MNVMRYPTWAVTLSLLGYFQFEWLSETGLNIYCWTDGACVCTGLSLRVARIGQGFVDQFKIQSLEFLVPLNCVEEYRVFCFCYCFLIFRRKRKHITVNFQPYSKIFIRIFCFVGGFLVSLEKNGILKVFFPPPNQESLAFPYLLTKFSVYYFFP